MAASITSRVYIQVMEDVMNKVRYEFVVNNDGGPGEEVLRELQATWETKMMESGAILRPVYDLNVPYVEYEAPIIQTPLPGTNIPTGPSDYYSTPGNTEVKGRKRSGPPYEQPFSPWMNQRPPLDVNNVTYVELDNRRTSNQPLTHDFFFTSSSGKRKRDDSVDECQRSSKGKSAACLVRPCSRIPQLDGPIPFEEEDDDDEPPLNEDDDDDELDDVDQEEDLDTQNLVLAQFDKVSRTKSRWKCALKDGIMRINKKDILFNKVTGEFDF